MNAIFGKVEKYIWDNGMLPEGAHVVAGISGGADSMCLLFVLMTLAKQRGLKLCAVHIHHGIRGEDADNDEKFVEKFCESHGVLWKTYRGDIPAMAKLEKMSQEEAGRRFRYDCFNRALSELCWDDGKIAVAHNKNDAAETFLMNIFRGSGLDGLASIPPVRGNIIRPLLCLTRREIEALLLEAGIGFCTDKTNLENNYTRNRLRNELIPYIEANINDRGVDHMVELAGQARELSEYMKEQSLKAYKEAAAPGGGLLVTALTGLPKVLVGEVIRRAIENAVGKLKDITRSHIEQAAGLLTKPVGKEIQLPYGLTVRRGYETLEFIVKPGHPEAPGGQGQPGGKWQLGGQGQPGEKWQPGGQWQPGGPLDLELPEYGGVAVFYDKETKLCLEIGIKTMEAVAGGVPAEQFVASLAQKNERNVQNQCTKWFDYDKIENGLQLRCRCDGDYMVIDRQGRRKLLRRLLIDEKVPREERDTLRLIADGSHIIWIPGGRMSEAYKITSQTKKILEIKFKGEE